MKKEGTKTIAVLTWRLRNFGTALQAFALQHWLNDNGSVCRVINYTLPPSNKIIRVNPISFCLLVQKIQGRLKNAYERFRNKDIKRNFENKIQSSQIRFKDFYSLIPTEETMPNAENKDYYDMEYDHVIVGSDQVWSPKYFSETYFLDFVADEKKISYAPSLGVSVLTQNERNFILKRINSFSFLSVREKTSAHLLQLEKECVVCDPVLLFTSEEWNTILNIQPKIENYLFIYTLSTHYWYLEVIEATKKMYNVDKVILVCPEDKLYFYYNKGYEIHVDFGPKEWLEYLQAAKVVITDSFHGVCFSSLYHKEFVALKRFNNNDKGNENARVTDLLAELGLQNHLIGKDQSLKRDFFLLDYKYEENLSRFRDASKQYLFKILQSKNI